MVLAATSMDFPTSPQVAPKGFRSGDHDVYKVNIPLGNNRVTWWLPKIGSSELHGWLRMEF